MSTAIIRKAYKNAQLKTTATGFLLLVRYVDFDKFSLPTFNRLAYK